MSSLSRRSWPGRTYTVISDECLKEGLTNEGLQVLQCDCRRNIEISMNSKQAVDALGALAHESRLWVYRLLVEAGPEGLNAGTIATRLKMPPSSMTFHLQNLHRAGLITQERRSREVIYAADFNAMNGLVGYLTENCCGRDTSACGTQCAPTIESKNAKKSSRAA